MIRSLGTVGGITTQPQGVAVVNSASMIKSIQYKSITIPAGSQTATVDITDVDLTKAVIMQDGSMGSDNVKSVMFCNLAFVDANTVIASRDAANGTYATVTWFKVIEFENLKSLQSGTCTANSGATVSTVDMNKALLFFSSDGYSATDGTIGRLVSPTSIDFSGSSFDIVNWFLAELY